MFAAGIFLALATTAAQALTPWVCLGASAQEALAEPVATVTVTFESNGGSAVDSQVVEVGSLVATPAPDPTKVGYAFGAWYSDADLITLWDFALDPAGASDFTLYARWAIDTYTVTFDGNGGTPASSSATATFGASLGTTMPTDPTRTGYTFAGWNTAADGSGSAFSAATPVEGEVTVYAQWAIDTYTVTFDGNGGTPASSTATATFDASLGTTMPTDPTRTGYTFAGWNTAADGSGDPFSASTPIQGDLTVYAQWAVNSYTVTFDGNGGTPASSTATSTFEASLGTTMPTDPTRTGYTFAGWNTAADGSGDPFSASTPIQGDLTVYAQWAVNSYTVTFDGNGGTPASSTATSTFDASLGTTMPADPGRTGYTFAGWNTAADGSGSAFSAATPVEGDVTVYAQWTIRGFKVAFDSNGGSGVDTQTVAYGSLVATPTPPVRAAYMFDGWFADAALTALWDFSANHVPAADLTLYAKWTRVYLLIGSVGPHGSLTIGGPTLVREGGSVTVGINPEPGYGIVNVVVDGVSQGAIPAYTFAGVTTNHTISATFKRVTSTALTASAKSIRKGRYVTLNTKVSSPGTTVRNVYIRFEVRLPGSKRFILLKKMKLNSSGRASYRYRVLNRGTRYHRVVFQGDGTYLPAPLKPALALRVR